MHDRVRQQGSDAPKVSSAHRNDEATRAGLIGRLQQLAGNHAVTRLVQREPFGTPTESPYQLHLDPEIEAQIRAINAMNTMLAPEHVQAGLLDLTLPTLPPPGPTPQAPPAPAPAPATATRPTPDTGSTEPRAGTVGDVWKAVLVEPSLGPTITALGNEAVAKATSEFGQLSTGGKVAVVSGAVTIAGGAIAGVLATPEARDRITAMLNDMIIPVPKVPGLGVQLNLSGENVIVGLHLDVGRILPAALGFGPASNTTPLGAPPNAFEPVQRQLTVQRDPLTGGVGGQVSDHTGGAIGLQSVEGSFVLAGGTILSATTARVLKTVGPAPVTVKISGDSVDVSVQGGLFIDAQWPVQNMRLEGVTHRFGSNETTAYVGLVNDEWGDGFIDMTDSAKASIAEMVGQIIARTPLDRSRLSPAAPSVDTRQPPGPQGPPVASGSAFGDRLPTYDPLRDADPQATLRALIANLKAMPSDGESDVGAEDVSDISVGATIAVDRQFEQIDESGTGVRIATGTPVSIRVDSGASVADLEEGMGQGAAGVANAAKIRAIHATCAPGITVVKGNEPVAAIHGVTVSRGGTLSIDRTSLLGDAAAAGALESLFWAGLGGLAGASKTGVPLGGVLGAEKTVAEGKAEPVLIGGLVKDALEAKLRTVFTELLGQYGRTLIPGVDLGSVLGVPGAPVAPK